MHYYTTKNSHWSFYISNMYFSTARKELLHFNADNMNNSNKTGLMLFFENNSCSPTKHLASFLSSGRFSYLSSWEKINGAILK